VELITGKGERGKESENEVDSSFKINILWDMNDLIPYLVPTQFQELIFPPKTRPIIPAQMLNFRTG
jgi:hypothetical protein